MHLFKHWLWMNNWSFLYMYVYLWWNHLSLLLLRLRLSQFYLYLYLRVNLGKSLIELYPFVEGFYHQGRIGSCRTFKNRLTLILLLTTKSNRIASCFLFGILFQILPLNVLLHCQFYIPKMEHVNIQTLLIFKNMNFDIGINNPTQYLLEINSFSINRIIRFILISILYPSMFLHKVTSQV